MELPQVRNTAIDKARNITFNVLAYRNLTPNELRFAIRVFESSQKRKLKKNSAYTIVSTIGA